MNLYEKAKSLLYSEYQRNYEVVKENSYHQQYANEKLRHSLQVAGVGNGILRNEDYFQHQSAEFLEMAKVAILLHDIFRFRENVIKYQTGEKVDHGVRGADLLRTIPEFNHPLIILPVKHHGHMIEQLYEDEEYFSIQDEELKDQIKHIAFAVRDADKVANWHILTNEYEAMIPVWFPSYSDEIKDQSAVSEKCWKSFISSEVVLGQYIETSADQFICTLSWLFDVNYKYSIQYALKMNVFEKFDLVFDDLKINPLKKEQAKKIMQKCLKERFWVV